MEFLRTTWQELKALGEGGELTLAIKHLWLYFSRGHWLILMHLAKSRDWRDLKHMTSAFSPKAFFFLKQIEAAQDRMLKNKAKASKGRISCSVFVLRPNTTRLLTESHTLGTG